MKSIRRTVALLALAASTLGLVGAASAHVSKQDKGMYGILHIAPDDNPTAGQANQLVFYLGSNRPQYTFSLADCQCDVKLIENGKTIASSPLTSEAGSDTIGQASLTFPKRDVYTVIVTARAHDTAFPAFTLTYPVRVDQSSPSAQSNNKVAEYAILGLGLLAAVGIGVWQLMGRRG